MDTIAIRNGDFALGDGGFVILSGAAKLIQDLGCALREPIGTDRFHRMYGSTLESLVGQQIGPASAAMIQSEVERVIANYITVQQALLSRDALAGRFPRFNSGEVIKSVDSITVQQSFDAMLVTVVLTTLSQESVALIYTLEA